jgi:hypothetical protein
VERAAVLVAADDDEAVAGSQCLGRLGSRDRLVVRTMATMVTPVLRRICSSPIVLSAPGEASPRVTQSMSRLPNTASSSSTTAGLKNAPPRIAPSFRACRSVSSTAEAWSAPGLRPWTVRRPLWVMMTMTRPPFVPVIS